MKFPFESSTVEPGLEAQVEDERIEEDAKEE
jgi:hypothetical protein